MDFSKRYYMIVVLGSMSEAIRVPVTKRCEVVLGLEKVAQFEASPGETFDVFNWDGDETRDLSLAEIAEWERLGDLYQDGIAKAKQMIALGRGKK